MQTDREHRLRDNLGQTFLYTRWPQYEEDRQLRDEAVIRHKVFAQQHLHAIAESGNDPFHYGLLDLWLDVYREPWAKPRTPAKLVDDLAEKIASGELRVYLEDSLMWRHVSSGGTNGASGHGIVTHGAEESDKPRSQGVPYIPHPDDRYTSQSDGKPMGVVEGHLPIPLDGTKGVTPNVQQAANLKRVQKKIPSNSKDSVELREIPSCGVAAQATSPGKVPGSKAIYEKQIDVNGKTVQTTKTTYDPEGNIVHVKDKLNGGTYS